MSHIEKVRAVLRDGESRPLREHELYSALTAVLNLSERLRTGMDGKANPAGSALADEILSVVGPPLGVRLEFGPYGALVDLDEEK